MSPYTSLMPLVAALAALAPQHLSAADGLDEEGSVSAGTLLAVPGILRDEKRAEARNGGWPVTASIAVGAGWNSNIYDAWAGQEVDSSVLVEAGELAIEHRPTSSDRWRMSLDAAGTQYAEDSEVNSTEVDLATDWKHEFTDTVTLVIDAGATSKHGKSLTALGVPLTRETSYLAYDVGASVEIEVSPADTVEFALGYGRKDYAETSGLNSIDWDKMGGSLRYRHRATWWTARLWWDLDLQKYDEEPASDATGLELPTYPNEDHLLQSILAWWAADLTANETLSLKLKYSTKDDRYKDYESWAEWRMSAGLTSALTARFHAGLEAWYSLRDYENILVASGDELAYDKFSTEVWGRFYLNDHWSLFGQAEAVVRDTNNSGGAIYRDYTVYEILLGVAASY